jgi:DNA-binding NarL/FixJ family response regulator
MIKKIKIALADDEALFRRGVGLMLMEEDNFDVVFQANDGAELLEYLNTCKRLPDVILIDIKMPTLNGVEATKLIKVQFPEISIIALSSYISAIFVSNMIRVGASSYVPKNASPEEMILTINKVLQTGFYYNSFMLNYIRQHKLKSNQMDKSIFDDDLLTKREIEILRLLSKQMSAIEIAKKLQLSTRTVEGHRSNLLIKTESKNSVGLVVFAFQNNIISLDDTLDFYI